MLWSHRERLRAWGWEVVGTEDDQQLAAAPIVEGVELGVPAMREYAAALDLTGGASVAPPPAALRVLASKACRRAIKFGDSLDLDACQRLLDGLARCDLPFQCAHGRPTIAPVVQLAPRARRAA